jgi:hypothetical protein
MCDRTGALDVPCCDAWSVLAYSFLMQSGDLFLFDQVRQNAFPFRPTSSLLSKKLSSPRNSQKCAAFKGPRTAGGGRVPVGRCQSGRLPYPLGGAGLRRRVGADGLVRLLPCLRDRARDPRGGARSERFLSCRCFEILKDGAEIEPRQSRDSGRILGKGSSSVPCIEEIQH